MIVWGGGSVSLTNTGGLYDPVADSWTDTSVSGVPSARSSHSALWTGANMIIWGGSNGSSTNTGGIYSPTSNTWSATSTTSAPLHGKDIVLFGLAQK